MKVLTIAIILMLVSLKANGQKDGVIVDMTTDIPIRDVKIYTNNHGVVETNWRGQFHIDGGFTSVTIAHPNYLSLTLSFSQMNDTIRLIPKYHTLDEVTVYGKAKVPRLPESTFQDIRTYKGPSGLDFLAPFYKHHGLTKKQRRKHNEIIKNY